MDVFFFYLGMETFALSVVREIGHGISDNPEKKLVTKPAQERHQG